MDKEFTHFTHDTLSHPISMGYFLYVFIQNPAEKMSVKEDAQHHFEVTWGNQ